MKKLVSIARATGRFIARRLDFNDVFFWVGLICLWWGCWLVYQPVAPIVCGVVLLAVGLYGATRRPVE